MFLALKRGWHSDSFQRTVRDKEGEVAAVFTFTKDNPVEIPRDLFDGVKGDIGHALDIADVEKGRVRIDHEATSYFLEHGKMPSKKKKPAEKSAKEKEKEKESKQETKSESSGKEAADFNLSDLDNNK